MRTKTLVVVLGLAVWSSQVLAEPGRFRPGAEPGGFRGINWGTDISTLRDMVKQGEFRDQNEVSYTRKGDKLQIGDARLSEIKYYFVEGKFRSVDLTLDPSHTYVAQPQKNFDKMKGILETNFGQLVKRGATYFLIGEKVILKLVAHPAGPAWVHIEYRPKTQAQIQEKAKEREAIKDF